MQKNTSKIMRFLWSYLLLELSSLLKFNYIVGSQRAFFSAINCTGPLMRHFNGLEAFVGVIIRKLLYLKFFAPRTLTIAYTSALGLFNPLLYHIPTMLASGYWFGSNKGIRVILPMLCMILFMVHPIGYQAMYYSWFWFIPMAIHFLPHRIPFFEALGTTFLAHALGAVFYLYLQPMPAEYWLALIPVVIIERLLFASGMTLVYYGAQWVMKANWFNNNVGVAVDRVVS